MRNRQFTVPLALIGSIAAAPVAALEFETHRVQGLLNVDLSYGATYRLDDADERLIAFANGGSGPNVNGDDGELNYNTGLVSNMGRATAELIVAFENVGLYVRGAAFQDWVQDERLDRTRLSSDGKRLVGSDATLLDHYLTTTVTVAGTPIHFRLGDQVINWSATSFLRDGLDLVNPLDLATGVQPASEAIDRRSPQGMLWAAASLSEIIAVEGFYQYEWQPLVLPPVGSYFSTIDIFGGAELNAAFLGAGQYSDLGTNLDQAFALPQGTLGFDADFDRIPGRAVERPKDSGQFGISLFARLLDGRATQIGLHYVRYHSRLPLLSAVTADAAAVADTSDAHVAALAVSLVDPYLTTGLTPAQSLTSARSTAEALTISQYANQAGLLEQYPEDIDAIGASFSLSAIQSGTLFSGDIVHYFGFPNQIAIGTVLNASLSPILFNPNVGTTPLGEFGSNQVVRGYRRSGRTQAALGITWVMGPRLGAQQTLLGIDLGWVHVEDVPGRTEAQFASTAPQSNNAWGYRVIGQMTFNSVLGGLNLSPRFVFAEDVDGTTPAPSASFLEGRSVFSMGLTGDYLQRLEGDVVYSRFFGAGAANQLRDRDYVQFRLTYSL
ncbi:MAG TPA: DUF1302 family protein [Pseudomonadales bacterium]